MGKGEEKSTGLLCPSVIARNKKEKIFSGSVQAGERGDLTRGKKLERPPGRRKVKTDKRTVAYPCEIENGIKGKMTVNSC